MAVQLPVNERMIVCVSEFQAWMVSYARKLQWSMCPSYRINTVGIGANGSWRKQPDGKLQGRAQSGEAG
jgi:hypothetical protein